MKRKIIKQANQAYTITLPIEWVRANNITGKSEIDVVESEKSLIISPLGKTEIKKAKIDFSNFNGRNISRSINSLYARGIDEIEITSNKDISADLFKSLSQTIGFALVSQSKDQFIIKDIGGGNFENLDEIFKRVFQMILSFYDSAIKDIFGKEEEKLENLIARDIEINKFCLFLQRAINKKSYPDPINGRVLFTYSFELERIGDEIQRLWRTNVKYKIKKTPKLKEIAELSLEGLSQAFDFYYQFNPAIAEKITSMREEVREQSLSLLKIDQHTARFARHIVKIIEDAADLSHLTLMRKL